MKASIRGTALTTFSSFLIVSSKYTGSSPDGNSKIDAISDKITLASLCESDDYSYLLTSKDVWLCCYCGYPLSSESSSWFLTYRLSSSSSLWVSLSIILLLFTSMRDGSALSSIFKPSIVYSLSFKAPLSLSTSIRSPLNSDCICFSASSSLPFSCSRDTHFCWRVCSRY